MADKFHSLSLLFTVSHTGIKNKQLRKVWCNLLCESCMSHTVNNTRAYVYLLRGVTPLESVVMINVDHSESQSADVTERNPCR